MKALGKLLVFTLLALNPLYCCPRPLKINMSSLYKARHRMNSLHLERNDQIVVRKSTTVALGCNFWLRRVGTCTWLASCADVVTNNQPGYMEVPKVVRGLYSIHTYNTVIRPVAQWTQGHL